MNPQYEALIDGLLTDGYGVIDNFLPSSSVAALRTCLNSRREAGQFRSAGIGNQRVTVATAIRGDEILWLDKETAMPDETAFLQRMEEFVQYLNQTCYLGLRDYEFHYAHYPTGTFYKRHLDQFRSDSRRKLSVVCYLNTDWADTDGGQLVLYVPQPDGSERPVTVAPVGGRLICFNSDQLEHEVLPATRDRLSVTGWLKTS